MIVNDKSVIMVSACLIGLCTRYDGCVKISPACQADLAGAIWVPVCPEQLGGLPTPRTPADLTGGDGHDVLAGRAVVMDRSGRDVTENFIRGAHQCLEIARKLNIKTAFLRGGSPSCGCMPKQGVTSSLLSQHSIELYQY